MWPKMGIDHVIVLSLLRVLTEAVHFWADCTEELPAMLSSCSQVAVSTREAVR